jgi:4-hydroxybenzoate polyprenyltransferase/phosphoserine phosphatase
MPSSTEGRETIGPIGDSHTLPALCVDLDGTLIRTDVLHENLLLLLKSSPWGFVCAVADLFRHGIAAFKRSVSSRVAIRPDLLPYNEEVVAYLRGESARGRRILLVTAADSLVAEAVAEHLGIFDAVLASDGFINLKAAAKADRIRRRLGGKPFEYAGDSSADIPVWKEAAGAIVVGPARSIRKALGRAGIRITREFDSGHNFGAIVRAMRVYQWSKNVLIFGPLLLSHTMFDKARLAPTVEAFAAFCAAASAIYIVNDLLDLQADRQHPRKRLRPFAAGDLTIAQGARLALILLGTCFAISLRMPPLGGLLMALYVVTSLMYSAFAKTRLFLDVITLAGLYTVRLLLGGAVAEIVISPWTLGFSMFFFTSLASCKRLSELRSGRAEDDSPLPGRAYFHLDLLSLTGLACSSGYVAVLVMALYLHSPDVVKLYRRPELMWCLVPLLAYWISRAIMIANRGSMHDDPILFALRDRASLVVGFVAFAVILASL